MSVQAIIGQVCRPCREQVHRVRAAAIEAVAAAIAVTGTMLPSRVGRRVCGRGQPKHGIKRVDRLLSNGHVYRERLVYYRAIASRVLRDNRAPVVLIDWSGTVKGLYTLSAAVPVGGRAVTIFAESFPQSLYLNRLVEKRFLKNLRVVLGERRRPVLVGDAGFRVPFMRDVAAMGWHFVVRIRGKVHVRNVSTGCWTRIAELYERATSRLQELGVHDITTEKATRRFGPCSARLVLSKKPRRKGRKRPLRAPVSGMKPGHGIVQAAREPWLLASNTDIEPGALVKLYALRMQIEETFRDFKSHRFGWSLRHVTSRSPQRMTALLLLASLAMVAVLMLGIAAEAHAAHRQYQANTATRRVLSYLFLGRCLIDHHDTRLTLREVLDAAHSHFRRVAHAGNP